MNNYYKKNEAFQENILQKKQVKKKKRKFKVEETEDSLKKKQLKQVR